jgi:molybdopterin molybdotransferase
MRKLLTFEEAKRAVEANFKPLFLGEEEAVLLEAYNRVLSADIVSPFDIPGFTTSTVNGYAVRAQDTAMADEDEPAALKVVEVVVAGEQPKIALSKVEAAEVAAGAVLPQGADAVIAAQDGEREDDNLQVYGVASEGENVQKQGSDIQRGAVMLKKGQVLGSSEIGVLAALGFTQVKVLKIPMIAVLSVGIEVSELGKALPPGKTFDVNAYSISTAIMECGAKPVCFGVVPDDKEAIARVLRTAVASADMVVVCSSVDISGIAGSLGRPGVVVNGIAVKPGRQTAVVFADGKPVFVLPSNPSAALLMFQLFARSLVQRLGGRPVSGLKTVAAYTGSKMFSAKGSRTFMLVQLSFDEQCRLIADPVETSGAVSALAEADGFVELAENEQYLDVNQEAAVRLLRGSAGKA